MKIEEAVKIITDSMRAENLTTGKKYYTFGQVYRHLSVFRAILNSNLVNK